MVKLMVSVVDRNEALEAVRGGADIIDVKNPAEGALGAQKPWIARQIRESLPKGLELSITLGDLPYLPGTASLAAVGAALLGANYVKVGLLGARRLEEAVEMLEAVREAIKTSGFKVKTVACGYADHTDYGCMSPKLLPEAAYRAEADGILVDVKGKRENKALFNCLGKESLRRMLVEAKDFGLFTALAGGLRVETLLECVKLGVDVVGIRRGVMVRGKVDRRLVALASSLIRQAKPR